MTFLCSHIEGEIANEVHDLGVERVGGRQGQGDRKGLPYISIPHLDMYGLP